jgi:hypothetical protein
MRRIQQITSREKENTEKKKATANQQSCTTSAFKHIQKTREKEKPKLSYCLFQLEENQNCCFLKNFDESDKFFI